MPGVGLTLMDLVVPLSVTVSDGVFQWGELRLVFCCNTNPVKGEGHETIMTAFDWAMFNEGAESPKSLATSIAAPDWAYP